MMISEAPYQQAYVWIWLPGAVEPVVAGKLGRVEGASEPLAFNYGQSYLARDDAIAIYSPELPLQAGMLPLAAGLSMPGCIRDASPDAWGRRVLINRKLGGDAGKARRGDNGDTGQFNELTYLLESGSDRVGALDFQSSPREYVPRNTVAASLDELQQSAERVERGIPLNPELDRALQHGTSIGGARPKALLEDGERKYIAKFSSTSDLYSIVKAEFIAMRLAALLGIDVAPVSLTQACGKDVLLIERFDRVHSPEGWQRRAMVSALTLLGLDEMMARYASYEALAELVRYRFYDARATLKELFSRLVFNVLCGNTDDHARNHAAFWDGDMLRLTPAYDLCPQARTGNEASQAMLLSGDDRMSRISGCLRAASAFLLSRTQAMAIVETQLQGITKYWDSVCEQANLAEIDRRLLWGQQFLNRYVFDDLEDDALHLRKMANGACNR